MEKNTSIHTLSRAIILSNNHILFAHHPKRASSHYYLPGGHIEHGESAKQTLVRELNEEIGIQFEIGEFLGCLEYSFDKKAGSKTCHSHEYNFLFIAKNESLIAPKKPIQIEEHVTFEWIPISDISNVNLLPKPLINLIPKWLVQNSLQNFSTDMIQTKINNF